MNFFAIVDYQKADSKTGTPACYKLLATSDLKTSNIGVMPEEGVINFIRQNSKDCVLTNFGIRNGKIVESAGSFSRLEFKNGVAPRVLMAEYVSPVGRVLGYVLADRNGNLVKVKRDVLLKAFSDAKAKDVSFCQNAIYRKMDNKETISPYQGNSFYKLIQKLEKKLPEPKVAEHITQAKEAKKEVAPKPVAQKKAVEPARPAKPEKSYSEAQKKELIAAKKYGVDPLIVSNPKLSEEQMRIIWTAKKNKMASEYFANPKFSVEQMRFFAERLTDKDMFNECKYFINPKYNIDQLTELYLGVCDGIDYTQYANPELSAEDMYVKRQELTCKTYANDLVGGLSDAASRLFLKKLHSGSSDSASDSYKTKLYEIANTAYKEGGIDKLVDVAYQYLSGNESYLDKGFYEEVMEVIGRVGELRDARANSHDSYGDDDEESYEYAVKELTSLLHVKGVNKRKGA